MNKHVEKAAFDGIECLVGWFARNGRSKFHDASSFPWARLFEENYEAIRQEAEVLCSERGRIPYVESINPQQRAIVSDGQWKTFFFHGYGHSLEENMKKCPATASVLKRVPGLVLAFFSILEPGAMLKPHRGMYKGMLRYHLGVRIPKTNRPCGLTVGGEYRPWGNGQAFVFDDSVEHFAQNESGEPRVVLIVDFEREMPFWLRGLNRTVISKIGRSDFVQNSLGIARRGTVVSAAGRSIY